MKARRVNTPDQDKAIRSLMASRRARLRNDGRTAKDFPQFHPGRTTTAGYIREFLGPCTKPHIDLSRYDRPAPYIVGPEVTAEILEDEDLT